MKNWKLYVWEYLRLFLAVFCGFLAGYQLEDVIEHQRKKNTCRHCWKKPKLDLAKVLS
jgi:hypothetical protein